MRRAAKRDSNERELIRYLERTGATVYQINDEGILDLLVCYQLQTLLMEVKSGSGSLTKAQKEFFNRWPGQKSVVRTIADVKEVLRKVRMPIREYSCTQCGIFHKKEKFEQEPLKLCPNCNNPVKQTYTLAGIIFKGSGWYIKDNDK